MKKLLLFLPFICGACSSGSTSTPSAAATSETPAASSAPNTGRIVDEQNGFRGKRFGEPIANFKDILMSPWQPGMGAVVYNDELGKEDNKFGPAIVTHVRYWFANGKYYKTTFEAPGEQADKFLAEAERIYGPGRNVVNNGKQVWWEGQQAVAVAQETGAGASRTVNFTIYNKALDQSVSAATASR